ncbi:MAG: CRISPR-associated helicase Cas3' [Candidatus Flemingiibacterium sp.]
MMNFYAHKSDDERWQSAVDHSEGTEELSGRFAGEFGFASEGRAAGRHHDDGKYASKFQDRLKGASEPYEHSSAGMYLFEQKSETSKRPASKYTYLLLAFAIGGHHSGLPDTGSRSVDTENDSTFWGKMKRREAIGVDFGDYINELGELPELPELPENFRPRKDDFYSYQFLGRMLFSSLTDADFLDTERFMSGGKIERDSGEPIELLKERFDRHMEKFAGKTGRLNENRQKILASCRSAAESDKGVFRLTVPTGGGKTLSSMAFALNHAVKHGMKRIIYVIPYVSIIRQTVGIFKDIFGKENVLGHYSTADFRNGGEERSQAELASENWDKPIIVTTNVQFFESLHSNRTSNCRKLHNIAQSVLIFDEAQMLPVGLLRPCLRAVSELVKNYGCTAVLCTATQPALEGLLSDNGITASEICPDTAQMYQDFKRVGYKKLGVQSDEAMLERLRECDSALCVLNSRKSVREYYDALKGDGVYHLSTYMTPAHLGRSIDLIRERLASGERCIVISTSLIEAGVDVDFPAVFRETAGLDSIIQAGGRCNREGKRSTDESAVYVFLRETASERFAQVTSITNRICELYEDISSPEAIHDYFARLYEVRPSERRDKLDDKEILPLINQADSHHKCLSYQETARRFRYIDKEQKLVLIPDKDNGRVCEAVRSGHLTRGILRSLARDAVSVYDNEFEALQRAGVLSAECGGVAVLEDLSWYDSDTGLRIKETGEAMFG